MYAYMENMKTITIFAIISPHSAMCSLLKLLLLTIFLLIAQSDNAAKVYAVFDGVSVISGQWDGENEMLCANRTPITGGKIFQLQQVSNSKPPDQQASA